MMQLENVIMNDKIYIITKGCYSGYHICAVTMDKSRAENLKRLFDDRYEEADIEEYTLDEVQKNEYIYCIDFQDDSSPNIYIDEYSGFANSSNDLHIIDYSKCFSVYVRAKNEKHAMKIAQDEYARWKAEQEGVV